MFIKILLNYILGYVRITVEGYYIERFINICRNNKIIIWNLKRNKSVQLNLNIGIKDFKEIKKIAKKTKCKVKIIKKKGLPFLFNRYKKRKIFFGFLLLILVLIGISSNFIWNIEIKIENAEQLDNIYEDITSAGLETGKMKNKIKQIGISSYIIFMPIGYLFHMKDKKNNYIDIRHVGSKR